MVFYATDLKKGNKQSTEKVTNMIDESTDQAMVASNTQKQRMFSNYLVFCVRVAKGGENGVTVEILTTQSVKHKDVPRQFPIQKRPGKNMFRSDGRILRVLTMFIKWAFGHELSAVNPKHLLGDGGFPEGCAVRHLRFDVNGYIFCTWNADTLQGLTRNEARTGTPMVTCKWEELTSPDLKRLLNTSHRDAFLVVASELKEHLSGAFQINLNGYFNKVIANLA